MPEDEKQKLFEYTKYILYEKKCVIMIIRSNYFKN